MGGAKKILIPVDLSDVAVGAIRAATRIAKRWDAEALVMHVGKEPPRAPGGSAAGGESARNLPFIRGPYSLGRLLSVRSRGSAPDAVPAPGRPPAGPARLREDARLQLMARLETAMRQAGAGPEAQAEVVWGDPAEEILRAAESGDYGLIIMITRGRRGLLSRLFRGSVAEEVIRRAPCAVLAMRAADLEKEAAAGAPQARETLG